MIESGVSGKFYYECNLHNIVPPRAFGNWVVYYNNKWTLNWLRRKKTGSSLRDLVYLYIATSYHISRGTLGLEAKSLFFLT